MCLIKGAFVGEKNFERYQNARYNNKKSVEKIQVSLKSDKITGTLHEDKRAIIRNDSNVVQIIKTHILGSETFFP